MEVCETSPSSSCSTMKNELTRTTGFVKWRTNVAGFYRVTYIQHIHSAVYARAVRPCITNPVLCWNGWTNHQLINAARIPIVTPQRGLQKYTWVAKILRFSTKMSVYYSEIPDIKGLGHKVVCGLSKSMKKNSDDLEFLFALLLSSRPIDHLKYVGTFRWSFDAVPK